MKLRRASFVVMAALFAIAGTAVASDRAASPESLLSPESVLFLRYHGMNKAQAAYDQTAWAEVMRGEMGQLVDHLLAIGTKALSTEIDKNSGKDESARRVKAMLTHVRPLLRQLQQHGVLLGVECKEVQPPQANLMLVLPRANNPETKAGLDDLVRLILTAEGRLKIETKTIRNREVKVIAADMPIHLAWWMEGDHFVLHLGTDKPDAVISRIESGTGDTAGLAGNPLYRQMEGSQSYTRCADGFLDVRKGLALLTKAVPESAPFIEQLGLNGLKSITLLFGYQEKMNRSTVLFEIDGPRKGLLQALMPGSSIELGKLAPVPSDVTSFSVMQMDLGALYDLAKGVGLQIEKVGGHGRGGEVEKAFTEADRLLGIDIRRDLLGALGTKLAVYESPSEGFLFQGMVLLWEVKDEGKLRTALETVAKQLGKVAHVPVEITKHDYQGTPIHTVNVSTPGFFPRPSFLIHNGWLAVSLQPQPLKGLVLRGQEKLPTWKPTERATRLVAAETKGGAKLVGFTESDPRPTMRFLLSLAPTLGGLASSMGDFGFDSFLIPNGQDVTRHLFPNVFLTLDEGGRVRFESYTSINLPSLLSADGMPQWTLVSLGAISFLGRSAQSTFREVGPAIPAVPPTEAGNFRAVGRPIPARPDAPKPTVPDKDRP